MGKKVTLSVIKADVGGYVGKTVWYRGAWETHTLEISRQMASGLADSGPWNATNGSPALSGKPAKATVTG